MYSSSFSVPFYMGWSVGKIANYKIILFLTVFYFIYPGNLLGKYCGATIPDVLDTPDNLAYIKFVTDGSINAPGFMLHFAASFEGLLQSFNLLSQTKCFRLLIHESMNSLHWLQIRYHISGVTSKVPMGALAHQHLSWYPPSGFRDWVGPERALAH